MRWLATFVIVFLLSLGTVAHAAESIISPLGEDHASVSAPHLEIPTNVPLNTHGEPALIEAISRFFSEQTPAVLSAETDVAVPPTSTPTPTEAPAMRKARKNTMTITLVGDSMIDTLGPDGAGLPGRLKNAYPGTTFTVINHGVGAENIDSGYRRLANGYSYLGIGRDSVLSAKPDVIVVESFGYNPYPLPDRHDALNKHWLKLSEIVETIRRELPETRVVIAATIAPNWDTFGDGAPFISMSPEGKKQKSEEIRQYIESAIGFAKSQHIPLADAYHLSVGSDKNGKLTYINAGDHIHYSDAGRALMSTAIAQAIISAKLLE